MGRIELNFDDPTLERVKKLAEEDKRSRKNFLEKIILDWLKVNDPKPKSKGSK